MHYGEKVSRGLLVASRDSSESFEVVKENFDAISASVNAACKSRLLPSLGLAMNNSAHAFVLHGVAKCVRIVSRVANQRSTSCVLQQLGSSHHFMSMSSRQRDVERPRLRVGDGVDFR